MIDKSLNENQLPYFLEKHNKISNEKIKLISLFQKKKMQSLKIKDRDGVTKEFKTDKKIPVFGEMNEEFFLSYISFKENKLNISSTDEKSIKVEDFHNYDWRFDFQNAVEKSVLMSEAKLLKILQKRRLDYKNKARLAHFLILIEQRINEYIGKKTFLIFR